MNRFALPVPVLVTLEHVNLRDEKHGDETVSAIDIKLSMEVQNDVLNLFHPTLKKWVYCKSKTPPPPVEQGSLDLEDPNGLPDLRFPELEPLRWDSGLQGYLLIIEYGIGSSSAIRFVDCKVNGFRFECMPGGTVRVTWRVQCSRPTGRAVGDISCLLKRDVMVTLTSSGAAQTVLAESDEVEAGSDSGWQDATDTFVEQHSGAH